MSQITLDSDPDLSALNSEAPSESKLVAITDLEDLQLTVMGMAYSIAELDFEKEGIEGVLFDADGEFLQFLDARDDASDATFYTSVNFSLFSPELSELGFDDSMPSCFTMLVTDPNHEFNTIVAVEGPFAVASRPIPEPGTAGFSQWVPRSLAHRLDASAPERVLKAATRWPAMPSNTRQPQTRRTSDRGT